MMRALRSRLALVTRLRERPWKNPKYRPTRRWKRPAKGLRRMLRRARELYEGLAHP